MRFRLTDVSVKLCAVQLMVGERGVSVSIARKSFLTSAKRATTFRQQFFFVGELSSADAAWNTWRDPVTLYICWLEIGILAMGKMEAKER